MTLTAVARTKSIQSSVLRGVNRLLKRNFLGLDMGLEVGARKERPHIVQHRVNIRAGGSDRNRHLDFANPIPCRGEGARQGEGPGQFCFGAADTRETHRGLGSHAGELRVILDRKRFTAADIGDRILVKGIRSEGFGVDGKRHRE